MYPLKQGTGITIPIFVHDANGDAVTGITNGSFTKRISKNGGAFGAMTVTITELENGWYSVPVGTGHSDTLGILSITFTSGAGKQVNLQWRVEAKLNDDLNDFDAANDDVAVVTLVGTTTLNSDMVGAPLSAAGTRAALGLTSANMDTQFTASATAIGFNVGKTGYSLTVAPPTAIENADAYLDRDMSTGADSGSTTVRTPRQALRFLRNKWALIGTTLTVNKEDDSTPSWTATVSTDAAADPVTGSNPAGGS